MQKIKCLFCLLISSHLAGTTLKAGRKKRIHQVIETFFAQTVGKGFFISIAPSGQITPQEVSHTNKVPLQNIILHNGTVFAIIDKGDQSFVERVKLYPMASFRIICQDGEEKEIEISSKYTISRRDVCPAKIEKIASMTEIPLKKLDLRECTHLKEILFPYVPKIRQLIVHATQLKTVQGFRTLQAKISMLSVVFAQNRREEIPGKHFQAILKAYVAEETAFFGNWLREIKGIAPLPSEVVRLLVTYTPTPLMPSFVFVDFIEKNYTNYLDSPELG